MSLYRVVAIAGQAAVTAIVLAVIAGNILGQPILLGYVTSGSMEPTLDTGDGYIAIPTEVAGPLEEGDVIVFQAEEVNEGQLTTHRIVAATDRGYLTKGDANPFTDQATGEPPVKDAQIKAVVLQVSGTVVDIPLLGTYVETIQAGIESIQRHAARITGTRLVLGPQGLAYSLFGLALLWYVVAAWRDRTTKSRQREPRRETGTNTQVVIGVFTLVIVIAATASMVVPAGPHQYDIVSAEFDSPGARIIPTGTAETTRYPIANGGLVPVVVFLEPGSDGIEINTRELRVAPRDVVNVSVTLQAPPQTGAYRRFLVEHRYLAVLPQPHIRTLYELHPWLPLLVIDALLAVPFYLIGVTIAGPGRLRSRSRGQKYSASIRLRRWLRQQYQFDRQEE